jgi:hypothetical protein
MTTQQVDKMWEEAKKFGERHKDNYPPNDGWTFEKALASAFAYGFRDGIAEGRQFQKELDTRSTDTNPVLVSMYEMRVK